MVLIVYLCVSAGLSPRSDSHSHRWRQTEAHDRSLTHQDGQSAHHGEWWGGGGGYHFCWVIGGVCRCSGGGSVCIMWQTENCEKAEFKYNIVFRWLCCHLFLFVIVHRKYRPLRGGDNTLRAPTVDHHLCSCGRNSTVGNNHSYPVEGESAGNRALSLFLSVKFSDQASRCLWVRW